MGYDLLHDEIRSRRDLPLSARLVFPWLAKRVRDLGYHPGIRKIAEACGIDKETASEAVKALEGAGLVRVHRGKNGARWRYEILWYGNTSNDETDRKTQTVTDRKIQTVTKDAPERDRPENPDGDRPENPDGTDRKTQTQPERSKDHPEREDGASAVDPPAPGPVAGSPSPRRRSGPGSSLTGLPDPWKESPDGVGSFEFVWRMFKRAGQAEFGHALTPRTPRGNEYAHTEHLERQALELAAARATERGTALDDEFRSVLVSSIRRFAEDVRASRTEPRRTLPWKVAFLLGDFAAYAGEPKERAA